MTSPLLFVYYANDIDDPGRYQRMIDWLTERGRPNDLTLASRVKDDLDLFPSAVDRDLDALCRGFATGGDTFDGSTLVAFTNAAALGNAAFVASGPNWELRRVKFAVPQAAVESDSDRLPPLSRKEVFVAALQASHQMAGSSDVPWLLQTKSHGNASLALTTLFSVLRGHNNADAFHAALDEQHFEEPELEGITNLGEYSNGIGIAKADYLVALADTGPPIELVVMESCESRLDAELVGQIPSHVRRLFTVDQPTSYANVEYDKVFARCRDGVSFVDAVAATLEPQFLRQKG